MCSIVAQITDSLKGLRSRHTGIVTHGYKTNTENLEH